MKTLFQRWGILVLLMLPSFTFAQFTHPEDVNFDPLTSSYATAIQVENNFEVFSNQSSGSFTIQTDWNSDQLVNIQIFEISGNKIEELQMSASVEAFFFEDFPKGTYIIKMADGQQTLSKQLVVQ